MTTQTQTTAEILASEGIRLYYTQVYSAGYGHKKIELTFDYKSDYKTFSAITNNIDAIEGAQNLEKTDRQNALLEIVYNQIEQQLSDWCYIINNI